MKLLKYLTLVGLLCVGLTTISRANVNDLGQVELKNNGDATELAAFKLASGDEDATLCFKSATASGFITEISVNPDNTLHVEWDLTGLGKLICGFGTKDGAGNLVHFYSVEPDQGVVGSANLIVPGNGAKALSHLDVFCCPGGVKTPDSGTTAMLLGGALTGLGALRRFLKRN